MGKQKTIFDLFKEQEDNLSVNPSDKAWSRLEQKLDGKTKTTPIRRINWWAAAACMLALVGAFSILNLNNRMSTASEMATASLSPDFYVIEELDAQSFTEEFNEEWKVSNQYRARFANYTSDYQSGSKYATNEEVKDNAFLNVKPSLKRKNNAATYADQGATENHKRDFEEKHNLNYPIPEGKTSPIVAESANSLSDQFDWLLGDWEQKRADYRSVEKWVADSFNTINGTGYLLEKDDTIFTENMRIQEIGGKLYFLQNIDSSKDLSAFVLVDSSQNDWIFQNTIGTPKNVILSNLSPMEFQLQINQIAPAQTDFLRQRNILKSNNAFRKMKRVE